MRALRLIVAAALAVPMALIAQEGASTGGAGRSATRAKPSPVPVRASTTNRAASAAFLPERMTRIDEWLERLITEQKIPGAIVMLVKDGQVAYHKAYGYRDLGTKVPQQPDDIFRIASQTKAITSLAVMMLYEEGRFQLDDAIGTYLPAFKEQVVLTKFNAADSSYESKPTRRRITIRQLLTHTSGLDYADIGSDELKAIYAKAGITALGNPGDVLGPKIDRLGSLPLKHEPGERFTYSLSVDVLGRLVEVVSGMPLDQYFRTRIFEPLKMKDTGFDVPAAKRDRLVAMHEDTAKTGTIKPMHGKPAAGGSGPRWYPDLPAEHVTYFSGGGGLVSTTADYARFLQLFVNGGQLDGVRLLGRKTVEMMLTNQVGNLQPAFGLGFALETAENDSRTPASLGTFSWGGAFNTTYWADPKEKLVALVYTNTYQVPTALGAPFRSMVYAAIR